MDESLSAIEKRILKLVSNFLSQMNGGQQGQYGFNLDTPLNQLNIGSLERPELFNRIEKEFAIQLPSSLITEADTIRDLVIVVYRSHPIETQLPRQFAPELEQPQTDTSTAKTLVDVLSRYAKNEPERPHIYLQDEHGGEQIISYGQLFNNALAVAKGLAALGLKPGETVAVMLPTSEAFFYAFFGILFAGGIPVPIYPPFRPSQIEEYAKREAKILQNAEVRFLITFQQAQAISKLLKIFIVSLKEVVTVDSLIHTKGSVPEVNIDEDDPAMIQYTSGSTGAPKGVLLTHRNLLANIRAYGKALELSSRDVVVSWLPLYHDMGLIGAWFGSLYYGTPLTILSPLLFLVRPERWLWAIHYHRGSISAGPNFAYELCVRKITDASIEGLDLSSWRLALNGAEAIYPKTIRAFTERFSKYGFRAETLFPVYGLAECSVALTFPALGSRPQFDKISRNDFERSQQATPVAKTEKDYLEFVGCGKPLPGHEIRIMNENNEPLEARKIGHLQFKGPSAMRGYYHNQEATKAVYHDGWWDTGDFAYIADNNLFITGRKKDIIIKAGRNLYPAEIEELSMQVQGIRKGCVIAFGVTDPERGTEKLILVAETRETNAAKRNRIIKKINEVMMETLDIAPDQTILVDPGKIPKTSSGKLRRSDAKNAYLKRQLGSKHLPVWMQISRLSLQGFWNKTKVWLNKSARFIYTVYADTMLIVTALFVWLSLLIFPADTAKKILKIWSRNIFRLILCPISVEGLEHIDKNWSQIIVSNHCSYTDTLVLLGMLPTHVTIVAKKELLKAPVIGTFIKKLGHLTVDRVDFSKSHEDVKKFSEALNSGKSVIIFPEGTFTYATGLRPFKLGAFVIAAETGKPVLPIAIQGTRKLLRSGSKLLRPRHIKVKILPPLEPKANNWDEAVRLRNLARSEIAKYCGEATLDFVTAGPIDHNNNGE
jgi:fatty-acyl-CoA synthase